MSLDSINAMDIRLLQEIQSVEDPRASGFLNRMAMIIGQTLPEGSYLQCNGAEYHKRTVGGFAALTRDGIVVEEEANYSREFLADLKAGLLDVVADKVHSIEVRHMVAIGEGLTQDVWPPW